MRDTQETDKTNLRLERLETANRYLRWSLAGVTVLCALSFAQPRGAAGPGEIRASRFVVVDENGAECAVLGSTNEQRAALQLKAADGRIKVQLGISREEAADLYLEGKDISTFARLSASYVQGASALQFGGGLKRFGMWTNSPGSKPLMLITGDDGKTLFQAP